MGWVLDCFPSRHIRLGQGIRHDNTRRKIKNLDSTRLCRRRVLTDPVLETNLNFWITRQISSSYFSTLSFVFKSFLWYFSIHFPSVLFILIPVPVYPSKSPQPISPLFFPLLCYHLNYTDQVRSCLHYILLSTEQWEGLSVGDLGHRLLAEAPIFVLTIDKRLYWNRTMLDVQSICVFEKLLTKLFINNSLLVLALPSESGITNVKFRV